MDHSKEMGEEKIGKLLVSFSMPAIVGMIINALYNIIDSIFVGKAIGPMGLAAVTTMFPLSLLLMGFATLVGVGATSLVSIKLGEKKTDAAEKILGNAFLFAIIFAALTSSLSLIFLDIILIKLGATPDVLPYAKAFSSIILLGVLFQFVSFGLNGTIRAEGNPRISMATIILGVILNLIFNPLFLFVFKLGIAGSALSTLISQMFSAVWVTAYFRSKYSFLKLRISKMKPDLNILTQIFSIGISPFLRQVGASLITLLLNHSLYKYGGELAVASMGAINRISLLVSMPIHGISQGCQPIIGYNYGAKKLDRVTEAIKKSISAAFVVALVGFLIIQLFPAQIIGLFTNDKELLALGSKAIRIYLLTYPILGIHIIGTVFFQSIGKGLYSTLLVLSRQTIFLIPLIIILPKFFGLNGVWFVGPFADLASTLVTGGFLVYEIRKLRNMKKPQAVE